MTRPMAISESCSECVRPARVRAKTCSPEHGRQRKLKRLREEARARRSDPANYQAHIDYQRERYQRHEPCRERKKAAERRRYRRRKFVAGLEGHQRFVRGQARKTVPAFWVDDVVQESIMAGLRAAERWDPRGGASFRTWVRNRMVGAVIDAARKLLGDRRAKNKPPKFIRLSEELISCL